ncbi:hypothetical protein [Ornithinibacillus scapharcae]|uniref:hypothetical protein n=1 Tax=Ornithinibacillus scapharcae TaxID=1147159 RepID=UPI000225B9C3|nr:hypothetical protein [Ornithinibacillus scapharcae]
MQLDEIIQKVNTSSENLEFGITRRYVENNYELLSENKHLLNTNAREILNFVLERIESGFPPLTRPEMATINSINNYAKQFNLRGVKLAIKGNPKLFIRPEIQSYLNQDAKAVLEGMGVLEK